MLQKSREDTKSERVNDFCSLKKEKKKLQNRQGWKMSQQQENVTVEILTTQKESLCFLERSWKNKSICWMFLEQLSLFCWLPLK